jgi:N-acetylglutamate synthase-like GNAT family acetyltransferase
MTTPVPGYEISHDPARLDIDVIHTFLSEESYWSKGIPRDVVERAIAHSLCFGVYQDGGQIGFARVASDHATFALLADVFVLEGHRGKGLSKWLMQVVIAHPDLQGLRRLLLLTSDAHELYRQFGFTEIGNAWRFMEVLRPDIYER